MVEMDAYVEATNDALSNIGGFFTFLEGISGGLGGLLGMLIILGIIGALIIIFYKLVTGRNR